MMKSSPQLAEKLPLYTAVEIATTLAPADLYDLCDAADAAIEAGGGFGWLTPPAREVMEKYWRGVLVIPERHLLIARMDGMVCGSVQLIEPNRHNEAQACTATLMACFVAPWARGQGAARKLIETAEKLAASLNYKVLHLDIRETQTAAINMCESMGYVRWGTNSTYAMVDNRYVAGHYYTKTLHPSFVQNKRTA
jgi:ribosomal protein S18 acetylase RimI-like enzyme